MVIKETFFQKLVHDYMLNIDYEHYNDHHKTKHLKKKTKLASHGFVYLESGTTQFEAGLLFVSFL